MLSLWPRAERYVSTEPGHCACAHLRWLHQGQWSRWPRWSHWRCHHKRLSKGNAVTTSDRYSRCHHSQYLATRAMAGPVAGNVCRLGLCGIRRRLYVWVGLPFFSCPSICERLASMYNFRHAPCRRMGADSAPKPDSVVAMAIANIPKTSFFVKVPQVRAVGDSPDCPGSNSSSATQLVVVIKELRRESNGAFVTFQVRRCRPCLHK